MDYIDILSKANSGDLEAVDIINSIDEYDVRKNITDELLKYLEETNDLPYSLYMMGVICQSDKNTNKAINCYEKSAGLGNSQALFRLGKLSESITNKLIDNFHQSNSPNMSQRYACKKASYYYKKGVEAGNSDCMNSLAELYFDGNGVLENKERAIILFQKAADMNNHHAINNLAFMYMSGKGMRLNYAKAIELFEKAGDMGNALALNNLGWIYQHGKTVKKDYEKAITYYNKSIEKGGTMAMYNLGRIYQKGIGVEIDEDKALKLYEKSYLLDFEKGMEGLKELHTKNNTLIDLCMLCIKKNDKNNFRKIFGKIMRNSKENMQKVILLIFDSRFDEMYDNDIPILVTLFKKTIKENIKLKSLFSKYYLSEKNTWSN